MHPSGSRSAGALGLPESARAARLSDPTAGLADALFGYKPVAASRVPLPKLSAAVGQARDLFQGARYDELAPRLPRLIAAANAVRNDVDGQDRQTADMLLSDAYIVASAFMVKLNDDQLAWATADRAVQAAAASGDAITLADAQRSLATVMRRTGRPDRARELLITAADNIAPARAASTEQLSMYGTLLQVAAYTAAVDGDRDQAAELIAAAQAAATAVEGDSGRYAFGLTNVTLYQISIAQVLGDSGAAIAHAKTIDPAVIPTAERRGRFWIDVARAWHQWGKLEACYRALLTAERVAPAEVRFRPPVHRMAHDLLQADRRVSLPGLRSFAARIGVRV
ncbi:hypothetical protein [Nonomuraea ceibae]|uniref:hypothetical protein n=1 Tax=Nonomuraea ceibae TaxID=1935170 RepID=UPI001C5F0B86|nr:hypothetical protein [Nonomuraea ceibae]